LKGKLAIPGFIDSHGHSISAKRKNPVLLLLLKNAFGDQEPFYKKVPGPPKIFDQFNNLREYTRSFVDRYLSTFQKFSRGPGGGFSKEPPGH
jgi:hypothetical protein